jgi:hypothetical protein
MVAGYVDGVEILQGTNLLIYAGELAVFQKTNK